MELRDQDRTLVFKKGQQLDLPRIDWVLIVEELGY